MKPFGVRAILALSVAMLMSGSAVAASSTAPAPRVRLHGYSCQRAISPVARALTVTAEMRPLSGTVKLQMRFDLLSKSSSALAYSVANQGDLGRWRSPSDPTLGQHAADVWQVIKQVADLSTPSTYRLRVTFRWLGAHDRLLGTMQRTTPGCWEPELRPDLLVKSIAVKAVAGNPSQNQYVATIGNDGATAAGQFDVLFSPGGGLPVKTRSLVGLGAHQTRVVSFVGPACSMTSATTVSVDPAGTVNDFNRANNQLTAVCSTAAVP